MLEFMTVKSYAGHAVWYLNVLYHMKYWTRLVNPQGCEELVCCSIGMACND